MNRRPKQGRMATSNTAEPWEVDGRKDLNNTTAASQTATTSTTPHSTVPATHADVSSRRVSRTPLQPTAPAQANNTSCSATSSTHSTPLHDDPWASRLSPAQFSVLRQKQTDPAHRNAYDTFFEPGTYHCAGCHTPLYTAAMKFTCGCGWPAFWTCLPKAVREEPPLPNRRHVEIVCNACNGHLGHLFRDEGYDHPLNERHCVNSTALEHIPVVASGAVAIAPLERNALEHIRPDVVFVAAAIAHLETNDDESKLQKTQRS